MITQKINGNISVLKEQFHYLDWATCVIDSEVFVLRVKAVKEGKLEWYST